MITIYDNNIAIMCIRIYTTSSGRRVVWSQLLQLSICIYDADWRVSHHDDIYIGAITSLCAGMCFYSAENDHELND